MVQRSILSDSSGLTVLAKWSDLHLTNNKWLGLERFDKQTVAVAGLEKHLKACSTMCSTSKSSKKCLRSLATANLFFSLSHAISCSECFLDTELEREKEFIPYA